MVRVLKMYFHQILGYIVVNHIMSYAERHGTLYEKQRGYRSKRSCKNTTNRLHRRCEGQQTDVLIMNVSKAFDKVYHNVLFFGKKTLNSTV